MEAAGKAQLRSQLLASENNIDTLSGFAAADRSPFAANQFPQQFPQHANGYAQPAHNMPPGANMPPYGSSRHGSMTNYSNHDLVSPVLANAAANGSSSRKASMTSSSMRFFRRKGNENQHFDDDKGADIGDLSAGDVSFNDITHLRGSGRYNTSAFGALDSAPIIPVLGAPGAQGANNLNNVQYRKYMNHQKKLNLAHSARAMSLAGGNPMADQDPRSMSFSNNSNRAMSLGMPLNGDAPNPRAMSLNSNAMLRGAPHNGNPNFRPRPGMNQSPMMSPPMGGPRFGPQQGGPYMGQGPQMHLNSLGSAHNYPQQGHTMSLRSNGPPQQYRPMPQGGPRTNSLNNSMSPGLHLSQGPMNPRAQPMANGQYMGHMGQMSHNMGPGQFNQPAYGNGNFNGYDAPARPGVADRSMESLHNVAEEDEEEESHHNPEHNDSLPLKDEEEDDGDHIYTFDDEADIQVSRKSTVKKSNSMRVRKLDLFNRGSRDNVDEDAETPEESLYLARSITKQLPRIPDESWESTSPEPTSSESPERSQKTHHVKIRNLSRNTAFNAFRVSSGSQTLLSGKSKDIESSESVENDPAHASETGTPEEPSPGAEVSADGLDKDDEDDEQGTRLLGDDLGSYTSTYSNFTPKQSDISGTLRASSPSLQLEKQTSARSSEYSNARAPTGEESEYSSENLAAPTKQAGDVERPLSHSSTYAFQRQSSLSRSSSELKMKGLTPSSALINGGTLPAIPQDTDDSNRDKRKSTSSISSKSKNFIKRMSRSGSRRTLHDDLEGHGSESGKQRVVSDNQQNVRKPLSFTKEEMAIMTCNHELHSELQLMTSGLAMSIKRELSLESKLRSKNNSSEQSDYENLKKDYLEKMNALTELQEKLNKERTLRFISEEHAILAEHGQTPSALKLDYEKNEIYNQLLAKNDLVIQLQDKLEELSSQKEKDYDSEMLHKFNDLLKENSELKSQVRYYEQKLSERDAEPENATDKEDEYSGREYEQAQLISLKNQRDELRDMITKLTSSQNAELRAAQDRIKTLETKLRKTNSINDKLSRRGDRERENETKDMFASNTGGKLQGFSIVSPTKKFDDY